MTLVAAVPSPMKTHESHVTVQGMAYGDFVAVCHQQGLKPVMIDHDSGSGIPQMMTARFHRSATLEGAAVAMEDIAALFTGVVRRKLEYMTGRDGYCPHPVLYREYHSKYVVPDAQVVDFESRVTAAGGHVAHNAAKPCPHPDSTYLFATTRDGGQHRRMKSDLVGYRLVNTIGECVVFDDNPGIDGNWTCLDCSLKSLKEIEL